MRGAAKEAFLALVGDDPCGAPTEDFWQLLEQCLAWRLRVVAELGAGSAGEVVTDLIEHFAAAGAPGAEPPLQVLGSENRTLSPPQGWPDWLGDGEAVIVDRCAATVLLLVARPRLARAALASDPVLGALIEADAAWTARTC